MHLIAAERRLVTRAERCHQVSFGSLQLEEARHAVALDQTRDLSAAPVRSFFAIKLWLASPTLATSAKLRRAATRSLSLHTGLSLRSRLAVGLSPTHS
jgi:hypothetical protein